MNEPHKGKIERRAPAQQAQQPQPNSALNNDVLTADDDEGSKSPAKLTKPDGEETLPLDDARFTAGVVKLYEALLQEPIPEDMLSLVSKLGKQERK